jgi:hypothetical protein
MLKTDSILVFVSLLLLEAISPGVAWVSPTSGRTEVPPGVISADSNGTRRSFLSSFVALGILGGTTGAPSPCVASTTEKLNLSDAELKQVITDDILKRKFLATGNLTPSIYKPTATFTDEIDTYKMDQWIKGTQRLFVGEQSTVTLLGDVLVSPSKVEFRVAEELVFRIPFRPRMSLSTTVVLTRDDTGYITAYRELWDQDIATVLKSTKF